LYSIFEIIDLEHCPMEIIQFSDDQNIKNLVVDEIEVGTSVNRSIDRSWPRLSRTKLIINAQNQKATCNTGVEMKSR
jgi:hypothetical protein